MTQQLASPDVCCWLSAEASSVFLLIGGLAPSVPLFPLVHPSRVDAPGPPPVVVPQGRGLQVWGFPACTQVP